MLVSCGQAGSLRAQSTLHSTSNTQRAALPTNAVAAGRPASRAVIATSTFSAGPAWTGMPAGLLVGAALWAAARSGRTPGTKTLTRHRLRVVVNGFDQDALDAGVAALRQRLGPEHPFYGRAATLRRFVIARKLDVSKAEDMLNAHVDWRKDNLPVELTEEVRAELKKGKFYILPGAKDVNGHPVVVVRSGLFDPKTRDLEATIKAFLYLLEKSLGDLGEDGKFSILYDREGFELIKNFDFDLLKAWAKIASDNYPERLSSVALYPSGKILAGLFKMVSVFFDPRTRAKITMVQDEDELRSLIPADALPPRYGGTCTYEFDPSMWGKQPA